MSPPARSEDAILRAALDLLAEEGFAGLTVDAVAARAGVGKATIYRHWGSRARLVHDAAQCLHEHEEPPDTGDLRADLEIMLGRLAEFLASPDTGRVLASLLDAAERDAELASLREEHTRQKRAVVRHAFERAAARGELADDIDLDAVVDLTVGPLFYRRLMRSPIQPNDLRSHLDLVLRAVGAERRVDA